MEYGRDTGGTEALAVLNEFELECQLKRDASRENARELESPRENTLKPAPEEEPVGASGPGTEYWLP